MNVEQAELVRPVAAAEASMEGGVVDSVAIALIEPQADLDGRPRPGAHEMRLEP